MTTLNKLQIILTKNLEYLKNQGLSVRALTLPEIQSGNIESVGIPNMPTLTNHDIRKGRLTYEQ